MFGRFKKRAAVYPTETQWSVGKGERDGKPIFIRRNTSAASLAGHPDYRFRVGVAVPLKEPNSDGLPSAPEMNELNAIEDGLCARLEHGQQSLQVLSITTQGMREFVFYTRAPAAVALALDTLRAQVITHEIQSYVAEDRDWSVYVQYA